MTGFLCMQIHAGHLLYWPLCVWGHISGWHNIATCTAFLAWKCWLHSLAKRVSALVQWTQICLLISAIKLQWDAQAYHVGVRIITRSSVFSQLPWLQRKVRCQLLTSCLGSPAPHPLGLPAPSCAVRSTFSYLVTGLCFQTAVSSAEDSAGQGPLLLCVYYRHDIEPEAKGL